MNEKDFTNLVKQYEEKEKINPKGLKIELVKMLILGYLYFFLVSIGLSAVIYIIIKVFLPFALLPIFVIVLFILIYSVTTLAFTIIAILKTMIIRFEKPKGIVLNEKDTPELFKIINKYAKVLNSSKIHKVFLNNDMNVSVYQRPILGIFGIFRNYMMIGMPVFLLLSRIQFESVLAHEMGHISKSHGRFFSFIYRIREPWVRLVDSFKMNNLFVYKKFYKWFIPKITAMTFVISRRCEYEADAKAVELTNARDLLDSLALMFMLNEHMKESFWEDYYKKSTAYEKPTPIYSIMEDFFNTQINRERYAQLFQHVMNIETNYYDTHPSFLDRANAVNGKPELPQLTDFCAAKELLGQKMHDYIKHLEAMWADEVEFSWEVEREERLSTIEKLTELENILNERSLTEIEATNRAFWYEKIYGIDKAYPMYQDILTINSFNPVANFFIGRKLILSGDPKGIELLNKAIERDLDAVIPGTALICNFLELERKKDEADKYYREMGYRRELYYKLEYYRNSISYYDDLRPSDLSCDQLNKLRSKILSINKIKKAYILRKEVVDIDIKDPVYILFIKLRWSLFNNIRELDRLYRKLNIIVPKNTIIFNVKQIKSREYKRFLKRFPDSRLV